MKRTLRPRKDLDDESTPAFVTDESKKVPICVRCGRDVPHARSLYTLCEYCQVADLGLKPGELFMKHPQGTHGLIGDLAKRMVLSMPDVSPQGAVLSPAVVQHRERLKARGLEESVALRQAMALVADPSHRDRCEVCSKHATGTADEQRGETPW